jgi:Bacterial Ig-like domain (group 3)
VRGLVRHAGMLLLALVLAFPSPAAAEASIPTSITLEVLNSPVTNGNVDGRFRVRVTPTVPGGQIRLEHRDADGNLIYETTAAATNGSEFIQPYEPFVDGSYTVTAYYDGFGDFLPSESSPGTMTLARRSTTTDLEVRGAGGSHPMPGEEIRLNAHIGVGPGTSSISYTPNYRFYEVVDGAEVYLGEAPFVNFINPPWAELAIPGRPAGVYHFIARYPGNSVMAPSEHAVSATVRRARTTLNLWMPATVERQQDVDYDFELLTGADDDSGMTGNVEIVDAVSGEVLHVSTLPGHGTSFPAPPVGVYTVKAVYPGDEQYLPSESPARTLTVTPDLVHARDEGVRYATFYPVVDDYRDTLPVGGHREERIRVDIKIVNSSWRTIRTWSIRPGTGRYEWAWNGKVDGKIVREGTYRIVQTLTDGAGSRKRVVDEVALSHDRLVYQSVTLSRPAAQLSAKGTSGGASVTARSDGTVLLDGKNKGRAVAGWEFTLPRAKVYKSVRFSAHGSSGAPPAGVGVWSFSQCGPTAGWHVGCFEHGGTLPPFAEWESVTLRQKHRSGRIVRGAVDIYLGRATVNAVRVTVTYGVLR